MKTNKNYEIEFSLKDLFFNVLYKWRIVLLFALIAAGVFGFLEYWSFEKYHRAGELTPEEIKYEADVQANQEAIEQVETDIAGYEKLIQEKTNYRETSVLMKLDPTNIWTAEKKYYLNVEPIPEDPDSNIIPVDPTGQIITALSEAFSVDVDDTTLMEVFGTDDRKDINELATISVNRNIKMIYAVGCGATKEEAVKRKELVDQYLLGAVNKLAQNDNFTLEILSDNVKTKAVLTNRYFNGDYKETDLANIQNTVSENIRYYQNQQAGYINTRNALLSQSFVKPTPKTKSQAILGFIVGAILGVILFIILYLFSGRLKTTNELRNRYDLSLLGEFTHSRAWWKGKGLDWVLERMEFGKKTDVENELNSIASLVDPDKNGKTILLTSTLEEKEVKKVYDGLASRLQEKGIDLVLQPEYLHNSEAVSASGDLDSVIVVEEKYKSRIRDLNRMAEMMTIEDARVIGAVLI